jgi:two-component system copper resistance phosphate regulon response regulator CusR
MRLLVVEDDAKVARALQQGLEGEGFETHIATTGEDGFFQASQQAFDLILLDVMLPGRDGFEVLSTLRARHVSTAVLILTARDGVHDRVRGLDLGADDYLVKPFAFPELLARVRALLRRGRPDQAMKLKVADLEMDLVSRLAQRRGERIDLTAREYELLEYLMRHQGQLVSREMLAQDVWKEPDRGTPLDNVIDVHMTRVRRKIEVGAAPKLLHTVRGLGFVLKDETV